MDRFECTDKGMELASDGDWLHYADAQAQIEALQRELRLSRFNQANAEAEYNGLQVQIRTLTQQLDAEREKVKELEEQLRLANCDQVNTENDLNDVTAQLATLQAQLRRVEGERDEAKGNYDRACMTIASMHSAAVGTVGNGPKRGVVEDVEDLRTAYTTLRQLVEAAN